MQVPQSLSKYLDSTFDYAGMAPPASLPFQEAVRNYCSYKSDPFAPFLGRFVVDAKLDASGIPNDFAKSVVFRTEISGFEFFEIKNKYLVHGDQTPNKNAFEFCLHRRFIESDIADAESFFREVHARVGKDTECFYEAAQGLTQDERLRLVEMLTDYSSDESHSLKAGFKLRLGGGKIPSPQEVVDLLNMCVGGAIPVKATQGLHQPITTVPGEKYGFINLLLAAAFLHSGEVTRNTAVEILSEKDPTRFWFEADGCGWKKESLTIEQVEFARKECLRAIGTCSFTEPIESLQALGLIG